MTLYDEYMIKHIANEIKAITDPKLLNIYLQAISAQRCHICGADEGTCRNGLYNCYYCRQLDEMCKLEAEHFEDDEEETDEDRLNNSSKNNL